MTQEDQRKRTQDDLRAFPMHCMFVACLSWNPKSSHAPLSTQDALIGRCAGLFELAGRLPDPLWRYDPAVDDSAIFASCERVMPTLYFAATQGDATAQLYLGCLHGAGWGVVQNFDIAVEWLRKSAGQGNATAQLQLGTCHEYGESVPKDPKQAVHWWDRAAAKGNMFAQSRLAHAILSSYVCQNDREQAYKLFREAALQGERYAQYQMGEYYEGELQDDGNRLGYEPQLAFQWFLKAAEQGCEWSQIEVARCYARGRGVPENPARAVEWYRRVPKNDKIQFGYAQLALGGCYEHGFGVEKSIELALSAYTNAAQHGDESAQYVLGEFYEAGKYVEQDYSQALYWYRKAVEQSPDISICRKIGEWCLRGEIVPRDEDFARKLLTKVMDEANRLGCFNEAFEIKEMLGVV